MTSIAYIMIASIIVFTIGAMAIGEHRENEERQKDLDRMKLYAFGPRIHRITDMSTGLTLSIPSVGGVANALSVHQGHRLWMERQTEEEMAMARHKGRVARKYRTVTVHAPLSKVVH